MFICAGAHSCRSPSVPVLTRAGAHMYRCSHGQMLIYTYVHLCQCLFVLPALICADAHPRRCCPYRWPLLPFLSFCHICLYHRLCTMLTLSLLSCRPIAVEDWRGEVVGIFATKIDATANNYSPPKYFVFSHETEPVSTLQPIISMDSSPPPACSLGLIDADAVRCEHTCFSDVAQMLPTVPCILTRRLRSQ